MGFCQELLFLDYLVMQPNDDQRSKDQKYQRPIDQKSPNKIEIYENEDRISGNSENPG